MNAVAPVVEPSKVSRLLDRSVETIEVRADLEAKLRSGRPLRVKMGFDPSAPDIHLGHYVGLRKLREFQELGHQVVIIVGDWTARIGDPSGRSVQRKMLTAAEVQANAQTYLDQFFMVVDRERTEVRWQSSWFDSFDLAAVMRLTSTFTVAQMLAREDFQQRYASGSPISIVEFLYPILQAYDSVAVEADVELGGTDQTFNLLVGRDIQREMGQEPQNIMTVPILVGTDGERKMSKSLGNYIGIAEPPTEMYGKVMSIPDTAIEPYLRLVSSFEITQIEDWVEAMERGALNPRDVKDQLAQDLVTTFHSADAASASAEEFARVFQQRQAPAGMADVPVAKDLSIVELLKRVGFAASNNEARRLIEQGGVRIDGEPVRAPDLIVSVDQPLVLQAGRRRFVRLVPEA
jgi:tyrosyl-tRNA synthetase